MSVWQGHLANWSIVTLDRLDLHSKRNAVLGLAAGVLTGVAFSFTFANFVSQVLSVGVDAYGYLAPWVIYFVVAPSMLKVLRRKGPVGSRFSAYTFLWFARLRLGACLVAVGMVTLIYRLPLAPAASGDPHFANAVGLSLGNLVRLMLRSPYFGALAAAFVSVALLYRVKGAAVDRFATLPDWIERAGSVLTKATPVFAFFVGAYLVTLPVVLRNQLRGYDGQVVGKLSVLGWTLSTQSMGGILLIYVTVSLLTGAVCTVWHMLLLLRVHSRVPGFSVAGYLRGYFSKIYPLLWTTASEALAMPSNMHLIKKNYPFLDDAVRQFTIGLGSLLNVNGTLTCCFVMVPAVCGMLGIQLTLVHLLACLPVVYLVGFGVPGIPGELVLFAGPLLSVLPVPPGAQSLFLVLFLGLQVGLPDSFRTGANSTDNGPAALLLDAAYRRMY